MNGRQLILGKDLEGRAVSLPPEPSEKLAVVGVSGSGKSFLASLLAEEWMVCGVKIGVCDPVGIWFGLRTGYDGDPRKGMPIRVYGGLRGDAQLPYPDKAAEEFMTSEWSAVYDLSAVTFETLQWWTASFLNRVGELGPRNSRPTHLIFEEAPMFAAQSGALSRYSRACRAAMTQCSRVYRNFGIGMTVITQRAASLDKTVLTQAGTLIALRLASRIDRRSMMDWSASNSGAGDIGKSVESLATAPVGTGILWSPEWGGVPAVAFRAGLRSTYHPSPRQLERNKTIPLSPLPDFRVPEERPKEWWRRIF